MKSAKEKLRALSSSITQCDDDTRLLQCGILTGLLGVIVAVSIHVEMGNFFLFPLVVNAFCMGLAAALVGSFVFVLSTYKCDSDGISVVPSRNKDVLPWKRLLRKMLFRGWTMLACLVIYSVIFPIHLLGRELDTVELSPAEAPSPQDAFQERTYQDILKTIPFIEVIQTFPANLGLSVVQPEAGIPQRRATAMKNLGPNIFPFFSGLLPHMTLSDRARVCTDTLWTYISMLFVVAVLSLVLIIMLYVCPAFETRFIQFLHKARSFWADISGQRMVIPSGIRRNIVSKRVADQSDGQKPSNCQTEELTNALIGLSPQQRASVMDQIHRLNLMDLVKKEITQSKRTVTRLNASANSRERGFEGNNAASSSSENLNVDAECCEKNKKRSNILDELDKIRENLFDLTDTLRHPDADRYDQSSVDCKSSLEANERIESLIRAFNHQQSLSENKRGSGNKCESSWAKDSYKDERSSKNNVKSKKKSNNSNSNCDGAPKSESKSASRRKNSENNHGSGGSARKMDRKRSQSPENETQSPLKAVEVEKLRTPKDDDDERILASGATDLATNVVYSEEFENSTPTKEENFHLKPPFPKICEERNSLQRMDNTVVGYPADHMSLHADIADLSTNVAPETPETPMAQEESTDYLDRLFPEDQFDEDDTDYKDELEAFAKRLEMPWDGDDISIAA